MVEDLNSLLLAYVNKRKAVVPAEVYDVITTANICMDKTSGRLEWKTRKHAEGRRAETRERRRVVGIGETYSVSSL